MDKNTETVAAITAHIKEHGYPPTVRQLADALGLSSTASAHARLTDAVEAGLIRQVGPRRLIVVEETS